MKCAPNSVIETDTATWIARRDAGLSPADERELAAWLAADPRHRDSFAFHDAAWAALARPATEGHANALKAHLGKLTARRRTRRAIVGAATLVAVVGGFLILRLQVPSPEPAALMSMAQVFAPRQQLLPDGSVAELKDNARISVEYSPVMRRIVLLDGEAHFDVIKDIARPFVVATAGIEVRAVGTAFSVRKEAGTVEVIVTQGTVALETESPAAATPKASAPLATLDAGTFASVDLAAAPRPQVRPIAPTELTQRLAWRGRRLEFTRTPITEAVALFNRHTPQSTPQLAVTDSALATKRITGVIRADDVEAFVSLLESAFDVKAERVADKVLLRPVR